jgi:Zn-dependent protease with chaperone function
VELLFDSRVFGLMRQSVVSAGLALAGEEALLRLWQVADPAARARFRLLVMGLAALLPLALLVIPGADRRPILLDTSLFGELRLAGLRLDAALALLMAVSGAAFLAQELWPPLRQALRGRRPPAAAAPELDAEVAGLAARFAVAPPAVLVTEDHSAYAGVRGLRRPRLHLSTGALALLDETERRGAVAHELAHLRRRDTLVGAGVAVLRVLVFFNPFALLAFRRAVQDLELAADDLARRTVPGAALGLAGGLAKFCRAGESPGAAARRGRLAAAVETIESAAHRRLIEERIERLLWPDSAAVAPGRLRFTFAALGLGAVLCLIA